MSAPGPGTLFPAPGPTLAGPHLDPGATEIDTYAGVLVPGASVTPSATVTGPPAFGAAAAAGAAAAYSRGDHIHGLPANPAPAASGTVTGPPAFGAAPVVGVAATFSKGDHIHGLPASPTPASPLTGAGGTGDATGGAVTFANAAGAAGGAAEISGGHANTHNDRTGGEITAEPGTAFFGAAEIRSGSTGTPHAGPNFVRVEGNDTDAVRIVSQNGVVFILNLPAADPHVVGRLFLTGTALQVSAG